MQNRLHCLMFSGAPLDDGLRTALYMTARDMIRGGLEYAHFVDENGQGGVSTKNKHHTVGGMSGILFSADIDWKDHSTKCTFLVRPQNMLDDVELMDENFKWFGMRLGFDPGDAADWWKNQ